MPVFIADDDLAAHSSDASYVAAKADDFIRSLQAELDSVRAAADAAAITAEQTCSLLEHKFLALSADSSKLQSENAQLQSSLDERLSELAQLQAQKHQLHLHSIGKDGEIERLTMELSELQKSKRQLLELLEQKDLEISEKNATITGYLDKIVNLTDRAAQREARSIEIEAELARSQGNCARLSQEKELIQRHNTWLNDELTSKVDELIELRRSHADLEEDMSAKLADTERQLNECSSSLKWNMERVKELETKLTSVQEELFSSKDTAAANEDRFTAEISTVNKLVELYKESSDEWSRKAGELEGVIKALETHLSQVENDYRERLEKEVSARKQLEKEAADLKDKLQSCEAEVESSRKANELNLLPIGSFSTERWANGSTEEGSMLVPRIPVGVSGTALAASLLRDGWSLGKMYAKYQEAVDALRHEQLGRKESEAVLQRVLCELEEKAGLILDERAEYERMVESYSLINQKLQHSCSEQANLEKTIQELKMALRRQEREHSLAQKEIVDLENQVSVLLKECRDIQLRCGSAEPDQAGDLLEVAAIEPDVVFDAEKVISERLLTFRDINGLVEQNVQLRSLVRTLSDQIQNAEMDFKNKLEMELKKHTDEAASKVTAVLQRAEEQGRMIESLHTSVAMYKRLYEEEHKLHSSHSRSSDAVAVVENGRKDLLALLEGSQEASKKVQERAAERLRSLEEELGKSRNDIVSLRSECEKFALDAKFANERLDSFKKEYDHQRNEITSIRARNVELSQLIVEYERKLRENSETLRASEERSRKLSMEVSVLKLEKDMLSNAEKRACDEVRSLSERVYRLQASLDTLQSAEEVREEARAAERRKQEEYVKQVEREWAEAKKELQQERDNVRHLSIDRDQTLKNAMRQAEEMAKDLANALHAVSAAETRASVAEAKLSDLEKKIKASDFKVANIDDGAICSSVTPTEVVTDLVMAKEEIEKLKTEAQANKEHMLQYKSIAEVNEAALKQMEAAHENFKVESEKLKESLEVELRSLRDEMLGLEKELSLKSEEVASAAAGKEEALASTFAEITNLKEESSRKTSQILAMEIQISVLKEDLEKEHERWQVAQSNYERQVVQQSETIKELAKTSQTLASLQQEASELRKLTDTQKSEIVELKTNWEVDKSLLENSKKEAEKKYDELNEQNKILHSRLEALHIRLAEKDRSSAGNSSGNSSDLLGDAGLQNVVNYLRRSKEIAETEISLLKQEKMRLQSQLESALKAAETAQASLRAERANSRPLLFSEEEIKSLQLQVREMNLLRESNMQLREENKHNFEECQKLREEAQKARMHSDTLESLVREREIEIEACKKEIEMERMEKDRLERRTSELLERCRNIDVQDYERMKDIVHEMQEKLKEKEDEICGNRIRLSKQQETISTLEQDVAKSESELKQLEKRINDTLQTEIAWKSELDKQKKLVIQWKKKADNLLKERDESGKEKQALSKQIEDLKQGKRGTGNVTGEQVIKEREEKEHRIQILEKTVERQREELRKEKEDHRTEKAKRQNTEKAIMDSVKNVDQVKTEFANKLETHRQALKRLSDELEKLKHAESNLPEGTLVVQFLSGTTLDDLAAAYVSAVENFERAAHSVSIELGRASLETALPEPSAPADRGQAASSQGTVISSVGPVTSHSAAKSGEEKEGQTYVAKTKFETRKTGRKLVRPRLIKPEEPQGDVDMSEADGSSTVEKLATSLESETQRNYTLLSQSLARKREASSASEFDEHFHNHGETSSDAAAHIMKRAKVSDSPQEGSEGQTEPPSEILSSLPAVEEHFDDVDHLPQGMNEEGVAEKDEVETAGENVEPPKESELLMTTNQIELQTAKNDVDETLERPSVSVGEFEEGSKGQTVEDNQQLTVEHESEREEGELLPDVAEVEEGADASNIATTPERDALPDICTTPAVSPARVDEAVAAAGMELGEINSPEVVIDEKNDEGDVVEESAEGSDKSNDDIEQIVGGTDQSQEIASVTAGSATINVHAELDASKQASSSVVEADEVKQVSPASNTSRVVNLAERARERAMLRQSGAELFSSPGSRGRGRPVRGRGVRGGRIVRGGRGQAPGQQG